jgi:hypothetical protein
MARVEMDRWCILRTAGQHTLALAKSLTEAGLEAWAPARMHRRRRPRSDKYRDMLIPAFSGYVFARFHDLAELLLAQHAELSPHPAFTVLQSGQFYSWISDPQLDGLREAEARLAEEWNQFVDEEEQARLERIRKKKRRKPQRGRANPRRSYVLGQTVRVVDPAFTGLTAEIVELKRNGQVAIVIGEAMKITVDACDVEVVQLSEASPERDKAA